MDILNIQALISRGRLVTSADIDPTETYVQIGVYQPGNRQNASGNPDAYASYTIAISEIGKVPSLQQVLDFNHDLVDDVNLQGTGSGVGTIGVNINAFGKGAASYNAGSNINALGQAAALNNQGSHVNAIGDGACLDNIGNFVTAIGLNAGQTNSGDNVIALGSNAGLGNTISNSFIISNSELPTYNNHNAAFLAISPTGIPGNTYLYYDAVGKYIGAVRL
jgi:hypothetical protein